MPPVEEVTEPVVPAPAPTVPFEDATPGVTFDGPITYVACDRDVSTLTFRITNPTMFTWHLDKGMPFPALKGQANAIFSLNGIEMNSGQVVRFNDRVLFGDLPFSSHCTAATVEPGANATCAIASVPLKNDAGVDAMTNELSIASQGVFKVVTFLC